MTVLLDPAVSSTSAEVDEALAAAWQAHREFPLGFPDRIAALQLAADRLDEVAEQLAQHDTADSGVPISITRLFAGSLGATFRGAASRVTAAVSVGDAEREVGLHRLPLGPAVVLAPWNAPTAVAAKKIAYAWAAGSPVIVKPSPHSPHGTALLVSVLQSAAAAAGLPPAAVQLVLGGVEVGQQLASSPLVRAISFTGSRAGGRAVAAAASAHLPALQLELGSNNPAVVLPDGDIPLSARLLAAGVTKLNGAWCESPGTVFVPAALRDSLVDALSAEFAQLVIGDPFDEATTFGPQAFAAQAAGLRSRIAALADAGARVVTVGDVPSDQFVAPTLVIDAPPALTKAEAFGPVLFVRTVSSPEEAVDAAFELETGPAGYVFTSDVEAGLRVGALLPAGEVKINGTSLLDMSERSTQEFWYGSGVGGHGDAELLTFFTGARIVGQDVDSPL